ncbi:MAG: Hsp20/alpha crystallin family protein [Salinispira sp.]
MSNLTLYKPGTSIFSDMDRIFGNMFSDNGAGRTPAVDVKEAADQYELVAELPGMDRNDVDVNIKDGLLTIEARQESEKKAEKAATAEKAEKAADEDQTSDTPYLLRERRSTYFSRSFRLPKNADQGKIKAEFANGLLTLNIPKSEAVKPRAIKIN